MINTLKPSTVMVGQFLHALLGKKPAEQMKSQADEYDRLAEIWDKGTVYFNHFFPPADGDDPKRHKQIPRSALPKRCTGGPQLSFSRKTSRAWTSAYPLSSVTATTPSSSSR
ncbi:uncharacterized protein ASPGLDRAFT_46446 [Aspergillus glaucus CBS 516.65]|uniref:Uncharacterized protein n=1 Tax=Aspergillus glaucus CBS 516.65 TaxID=1160497 RepID=A0A1L9VKX8_ASPGL|nr:hypothetical protein ASPGLDRAFT_46446 [Aspergillus glaucus CBS 516.65]OJJ84541.1 hypothetical protein ASPGLDRAFT_46446 [Aspergillus glaucus CBS 516.65]